MSEIEYYSFSFNIKSWLSSSQVKTMTLAERGAYMNLLCYYYPQGWLPDDDEQLAQLSELGADWKKGSGDKLRKCFTVSRGKLRHEKLDLERKKYREIVEKSRCGGLASAKSRQEKKLQNEHAVKGGSSPVQPPLQGGLKQTINNTNNNNNIDIDIAIAQKKSSEGLKLGLQIARILEEQFEPFNDKEQKTFARLARHLAEVARGRNGTFMPQLQEIIGMAKQDHIRSPKAMFVTLCTQRMGYQATRRVLK